MNSPTVIITGASSGIGRALAAAYLEHGCNVVGSGRSLARLNETAAALGQNERFLPVAGDIGRPDTADRLVKHALARFGSIDILINNAGIFLVKPFTDYSEDDLAALVSTNLLGVVRLTQAVVRHMAPRRRGHIVNISASIADQPLHNVPAAVPIAIKGGINHLTKALAIELAPHAIKVTAVAPGVVDTPMHSPDMHGFLNGLHPLGRMGTVGEVVDAVLYLTSADFTTGIVLPVDGGMTAGRW